MSRQDRLVSVLEVLMRIPPLFVMDSILTKHFLSSIFPDETPILSSSFVLWSASMFNCFISAFIVLSLTIGQMLSVFSYALSVSMIPLSLWWQLQGIKDSQLSSNISSDNAGTGFSLVNVIMDRLFNTLINVLVQSCLSTIFLWLRTKRDTAGRTLFFDLLCVDSPMFIATAFVLPSLFIETLPMIGLTLAFILIVMPTLQLVSDITFNFPKVKRVIKEAYNTTIFMIKHFGIQTFLEHQWIRLKVPTVLRVFGVIRILYTMLMFMLSSEENTLNVVSSEQKTNLSWYTVDMWHNLGINYMLLKNCETVISLLGMTSIISYVAHHIGVLIAFAIGSNNDEDRNMGTATAILFFILALQTGLTGLDPVERLPRLYKNFCLLLAAILHFVHSMVSPLLMSLSASHNMRISRHVRALVTCLLLILLPAYLLIYLWKHHHLGTWLLAVTAFSIEVIIKVIISILVYALFIIDACKSSFWEQLDDYVYYVKSTGSTIEFVFGIFLFGNGAWIFFFESGGTIRAVMMCIHAYFNIWLQAREGWKLFINRRTAVNKINSLPEATEAQLAIHNDVCAICYSDLNSARITQCSHYFHGVCLRKWLYVQDRCPLCHELIYRLDGNNSDSVISNMNVRNNNLAERMGARPGDNDQDWWQQEDGHILDE